LEISFSIIDLFQKQFGITPLQYQFSSVDKRLDKLSETASKSKNGWPLYWDDAFGRAYFMPVFLQPDGTTDYIPLSYPVITINCAKTIISTALTERNGTVKEVIRLQDYEIKIRGFLVGQNNSWPEDGIIQLHDLYKSLQPLKIICPLTDIFLLSEERSANDKVVIKSLRFPEAKGDIKLCPYIMELVSDEDFNLNEI